jgi:hypothetical protein
VVETLFLRAGHCPDEVKTQRRVCFEKVLEFREKREVSGV